MFCENCGAKIEDGAAFCPECGAKQEIPQVAPEFTQAAQATASVAPSVPVAKKKVPVYVWIIIVVVIAAAIAGAVFLNIRKHTININDYLTVEFEGYDSMGTAVVTLEDEFWVDLYEKSDFKDKKKLEKKEYFEDDDDIAYYMKDKLYKQVKYEIDPASKLTNDDEVEVEWKVKTDYIKKNYSVTVKADNKKFKVEGLKKVKEFNPFDDIEVSFSGMDGSGDAIIDVTSDDEIYDYFSFSVSDNYSLSTGDKITVTFASSYSESELKEKCAESYGKVPTVVEKEYTVGGLGHYVTDISEITEKSMADIITQGKEEIEKGKFSDEETLVGSEYLGAYLIANSVDSSKGNYLYLVYEVTVDLEDEDSGETDSVTYYAMYEWANAYVNDEEEGDCTSFFGIVYDAYRYEASYGKEYKYVGFETLDDVKADVEEDAQWLEKSGYELSTSL